MQERKPSGRLKLQSTHMRCPAQLTWKLLSFHAETVTITPKDARWVGAWWMGFLVSSALLLISSIPFWLLPRSLPKQGEDNGKPTAASETLDGTDDALINNNDLKFTEIAKGTVEKI